MSALRLARGATGRRRKIIKFEGCYHGHADALLVKAGSGLAHLRPPDQRRRAGRGGAAHAGARVQQRRSSSRQAFAEHGREIACVMIEPIAGNMNFVRASSAVHDAHARAVHAQHGALLVFDEVMTGFRVALGGAQSVSTRS